jgi:hypothetical protein
LLAIRIAQCPVLEMGVGSNDTRRMSPYWDR